MNKFAKSVLSVTAATIVATASMTPAIVNAWGDSDNGRATYTLSQINEGKLGNKITFNSITNGKIGDERNFVGAKIASGNASVYNADEINVEDHFVSAKIFSSNFGGWILPPVGKIKLFCQFSCFFWYSNNVSLFA